MLVTSGWRVKLWGERTKLDAEEALHLPPQLENHFTDVLHQTARWRSYGARQEQDVRQDDITAVVNQENTQICGGLLIVALEFADLSAI